jgi:hypothetical protein
VLPNIESILKPGEQELLQAKTDTTVHLQEIDEAIKDVIKIKNRATLDVTTVLDNLRRVDSTSTSTVYSVTGTSIFIIFLIALLCYYYRRSILTNWKSCMTRRTFKPKPLPRTQQRSEYCNELISTLDTVLPLNVIATDPITDKEEEAETALYETTRVPTPFVSRGQLPAP